MKWSRAKWGRPRHAGGLHRCTDSQKQSAVIDGMNVQEPTSLSRKYAPLRPSLDRSERLPSNSLHPAVRRPAMPLASDSAGPLGTTMSNAESCSAFDILHGQISRSLVHAQYPEAPPRPIQGSYYDVLPFHE